VNNNPYKYTDPTGMIAQMGDNKCSFGTNCDVALDSDKGNEGKNNTYEAMNILSGYFNTSQDVADRANEKIGEGVEKITPSRETVHTMGGVASIGLGFLSVTPYCGPLCAYASVTIDGLLAADHLYQGNIEDAAITVIPFAVGDALKKSMKTRAILTPKVRETGAVVLSGSIGTTILAAPEKE
tara:strand:- start:429 stop:977 length:549 start_codon:yes stop_codon:yes gene_type:complete